MVEVFGKGSEKREEWRCVASSKVGRLDAKFVRTLGACLQCKSVMKETLVAQQLYTGPLGNDEQFEFTATATSKRLVATKLQIDLPREANHMLHMYNA